MKDTVRQWVNLIALLVTIVVNGLANALPLNGLDTGEISDRFDVFFVPAGYVFSIWGLIYLALIAFGIYQLLPSQREQPRLRRVGPLFALSCVVNVTWLFLWHYEQFPLTILAMVALLASLIGIYLRLEIGRGDVSPGERWFVRFPFSLYLGWITVATIANATSLLYFVGWGGWGISPQVWAVIMLAVATVIAWLVGLTRGDVVYLLVLMWAFYGIGVKHVANPVVSLAAWIATGLVGVNAILVLIRKKKRPLRIVS